MAKQLMTHFVVTIGATEYLVEEHTPLKAQQLALDSLSTVRKATIADVLRIGSENVLRASPLTPAEPVQAGMPPGVKDPFAAVGEPAVGTAQLAEEAL